MTDFINRLRSDLILSVVHVTLHFARHIGGNTVFPHNIVPGLDRMGTPPTPVVHPLRWTHTGPGGADSPFA